MKEAWSSAKWLLPRFVAFAFLGYLLNGLIPKGWVTGLFGQGQSFGVPLAATLGLPLYLNTESSLPMLKAFLTSGMSPGAALAFLITGAGTSLGAITGALAIARWRVVAVVVATLWAGAILCGYGYNAALALGLPG
ncbi:MAG: permease [Chitinophagales bacterium]